MRGIRKRRNQREEKHWYVENHPAAFTDMKRKNINDEWIGLHADNKRKEWRQKSKKKQTSSQDKKQKKLSHEIKYIKKKEANKEREANKITVQQEVQD